MTNGIPLIAGGTIVIYPGTRSFRVISCYREKSQMSSRHDNQNRSHQLQSCTHIKAMLLTEMIMIL